MIEDYSLMTPNQNRFKFPEGLYRVTAGQGGESILIDGDSETAIYDCGMAYCQDETIKNIENKLKELGKDKLDYVILSHSHYDHIGALPYILKRWPDAKVAGGEKLVKVFSSEGAKATMRRLGEAARDKYLPEEMHNIPISTDGLRVDIILQDGDILNLGDCCIKAIFTPGHTDCSLSYLLSKNHGPKILFMSESVGVLENKDYLHTSILKSFDDTIMSANKLKALKADVLISSHFGVVPKETQDKYFDMYIEFAEIERDFILDCFDKGMNKDEIYQAYEDKYWSRGRIGAQPREAFYENAGYTISLIVRTFRNTEI